MSARPVCLFRPLGAVVAGLALFVSVGSARADMISIADTTNVPSQFDGTVSVTNQTTTSAVITIQLTNTSASPTAGYITGLAFNNPGTTAQGNITNVTSLSTTFAPSAGQNFTLIGGPTFNNTIAANPYGAFDIGAAVGGDWLGGGNPTVGIAPTQSGTFTFAVTGQHLNNLTAANLLAAMSDSCTDPVAGFAIRLRGIDGSYKDIAGRVSDPNPPPPSGVPVPPSAVLAGLGLGCLVLGRLRFRRGSMSSM
jgi:hypothetical protein